MMVKAIWFVSKPLALLAWWIWFSWPLAMKTQEAHALVYSLRPDCADKRIEIFERAIEVMMQAPAATRTSSSSSSSSSSSLSSPRSRQSNAEDGFTFTSTNTVDENNALKTVSQVALYVPAGVSSAPCPLTDMWLKKVASGVLAFNCPMRDDTMPDASLIAALREAGGDCVLAAEQDQFMQSHAGNSANLTNQDIAISPPPPQLTAQPVVTFPIPPPPTGQSLLLRQSAAVTSINDPYLSLQWSLLDSSDYGAKAESFWQLTSGLDGTVGGQPSNTVGVVDASFFQAHPDLQNRWYENPSDPCNDGVDNDTNGLTDDCRGWNYRSFTNNLLWSDLDPSRAESYHGTMVSGFIGAETNNGHGIASICPSCRILPMSVNLSVSQIIEATNYLIHKAVKVINFSFGGSRSSVLIHVMRSAPDTLFVVAAGNSACDVDNEINFSDSDEKQTVPRGYERRTAKLTAAAPSNLTASSSHSEDKVQGESTAHAARQRLCHAYPAAASVEAGNIVSVGSVAINGFISAFSNFGRTAVQVLAPGSDVPGTYNSGSTPSFGLGSGTSYSAPLVAGLARAVWGMEPSLTACQLRKVLIDSCEFNPNLNGKSNCNGQVNGVNAVNAAAIEAVSVSPVTCDSLLADLREETTTSTFAPTTADSTSGGMSTSTPPRKSRDSWVALVAKKLFAYSTIVKLKTAFTPAVAAVV